VPERPDVSDAHLTAFTSTVTSNYFDEMRMSVLRGRAFGTADDGRAMPVAIVSQALARRLWSGGQAIGSSIVVNSNAFAEFGTASREVVGVVNDTRLFGNTTQPSFQLYLPLAQEPTGFVSFVVRTADAGANNLAANIRHEVASVDPKQVVDSIVPFDDVLSKSTTNRRSMTWLMGALAAMAVGLAIAGLVAVIGASVTQRTREIGIRMALGAWPAAVVRLVLWQAVLLALSGVIIGLGLAAATTRVLAKSLYGVTPLDHPTFIASAVGMFAATMAASYLPARRATKVDPLTALRME
jgi:putative ABC transport system permease protein